MNTIKSKNTPSLEGVKKYLRKFLNEKKMEKVTIYLCDSCKRGIHKPEDGFIIQGNIYTANAEQEEGLVGDSFPEQEQFSRNDVAKKVFCKSCLSKALYF